MLNYQNGFNVGGAVGDSINPYNTTCARGLFDGLTDAFSDRNMAIVKANHALAKQAASDARFARKSKVNP